MRAFFPLAGPIILQKRQKSCQRRKSSFRSSCKNKSSSDSSSSNRNFDAFATLTPPSTTNMIPNNLHNNYSNYKNNSKILRSSLNGPQRTPRTRRRRRKRRQVDSGGYGTSRSSISNGRNPQEVMAVNNRLRPRLRNPRQRDTITPLLLAQQESL